jgi:hypothetical protein
MKSMTINASGEGQIHCVFTASGGPLYRFQNRGAKGVPFTHSNGPGALAYLMATDGIVVTDYPNQCP